MSQPPSGQSWFDLPPAVEPPYEVFLNGILQQAGVDFECIEGALVFPGVLKPELKLTRFQVVLGALGITGTYQKHDSLDVVYRRDGRRLVATGLKPREGQNA